MALSVAIVTSTLMFFALGFAYAQKLRNIHIQKQVQIAGSIDKVFEQVVMLENFPSWSPFLEADPTQEIEVRGTDGQIGAQYHWVGNKGKDVGYQEIKEISSPAFIKMECDIQKPFKAQPIFEYRFEQVGAEVLVTQDFYLESGAIEAFFMGLFRARKDMAKMNERGLTLLKKIAEEPNTQSLVTKD